ncbi:hypothetical protein A3G67_04720 [Candidatus Roizmanbacteria bacterium RIFCSPLOWO2_12_FULL_40_12]|uniref:Bacterial Ig domain-containing protein n=1 Tax=Candidatus Roizmanbacteria bacterium RIFCSPLOWO2_01_FULL_40_42 TaxID=1802066 RepID=A0A1F7J4L7_9BACT|nr:MAG: hypothetical protein A2779_04430 [Candidatus Roizmanbacteria bacterium RIFCSPHIGHO2_01_FULL_40_98]OGK27321.1 MAG: hypothetical protein A3C31_04755 [Candidatus Roizmanbacteria bacterium RIFCSPHIGHO2_02_FULL_40_53]OGK30807.1 MAG: hypothetical protein A2W49_02285 [Candidatus Roizmanbacteria bacterium RIFCSPHIGHO2_12_41_18]OGK36426.1 MAG: hypothetical protein A3E69_02380 [Candidatus Roizmanbacteria bacterium RIFCSPHIGHO2_12_FULL_40_130]OGK50554.1 MAG: hypothetical protein A3B50_02110 [Candi
MKKEVGIAIFFGVLLGLIVAVVIISRIRLLENQKVKLPSNVQISPAVKNLNSQVQTLEVTEPKDQAVVSKNSVKVKGKTVKGSLVIIQTPIKDIVVNSKEESFSADVPLALGENIITIASYPKGSQQRSQEKVVKVYYLDEQ